MSDKALPVLSLTEADGEDIEHILQRYERIYSRYPLATAAAVRSLIAEGRKYAATSEGKAVKNSLARAPAVRRGRLIWDACGLDVLADSSTKELAGELVDRFLSALGDEGIERALSRLLLSRTRER
mgnify:CR=1 FL=1